MDRNITWISVIETWRFPIIILLRSTTSGSLPINLPPIRTLGYRCYCGACRIHISAERIIRIAPEMFPFLTRNACACIAKHALTEENGLVSPQIMEPLGFRISAAEPDRLSRIPALVDRGPLALVQSVWVLEVSVPTHAVWVFNAFV